MPYFESDMPEAEMQKRVQDSVCEECGAGLVICWGGKYGKSEFMLRCSENWQHQGIKPVPKVKYAYPIILEGGDRKWHTQMEEQ